MMTTRILTLSILLSLTAQPLCAQHFKILLDLSGTWKFELGDDTLRAAPGFNDRKWDEIHAPSPWEDEGYPGYDGYAWYRKHFKASRDWKDKELYIDLGNVDDVDEVYVNGHFVGFEGSFPPHYRTAYDVNRRYELLPAYLNFNGDNVVAVRVYDYELSGGIIRGVLGIYENVDALRPDVPISNTWKFRTGDDMQWRETGFDDSHWKDILVPAFWETQGYPDYDGFGWYRTRFRMPAELAGQNLVLLVGKVDDLDETYLNGERIGRTGTMHPEKGEIPYSNEYLEVRAYTVPSGKFFFDRDNVLSVRVYDGFMHGGIYEGPIGVVTREHYLKWKNRQPGSERSLWQYFEWLFK